MARQYLPLDDLSSSPLLRRSQSIALNKAFYKYNTIRDINHETLMRATLNTIELDLLVCGLKVIETCVCVLLVSSINKSRT